MRRENTSSPRTFVLFVLLAISSIAGLPVVATGQLSNDKVQKIDALVQSYAAIRQFNGNVLVTQHGKVVFSKSYGPADFELGIANDRQTRFRIGSITKQFTALLIVQLAEKGLVSLDSSFSNYLPWYDKQVAGKITVRHLLSHSSGLENYTQRPEFYPELAYYTGTPQEFGQKYCHYKTLLFEPGTKFNYCNTDYYLLGLIIEAVTGKSYADVLRENILDKAGMKNSGIDTLSVILPKRAKGYEYTYEGYVNATPINMAISTYAAGAMYSTVDDLLRWQKALEDNTLLTEAGRKTFFTPVINNHALGLYINKMKNGKTAIGHPGSINGFSSFMVRFKEDDIIVILLDNSATAKRGNLDNTSAGIYSIVMNESVVQPKMPVSVALTETYLQKGLQPTLQQYQQIKNDSAYNTGSSKVFLNNFGYMLLLKGRVKESLAVLKLAVEEAPQSANTLDSYAAALKADKQFGAAIDYYKKILVLDPGNKNAEEEIQALQQMK